MADSPHRPSATTAASAPPPVAGMPAEVWSWLRESTVVRPQVVARVRTALANGEQASPDDVALAILAGPRQVLV